MKKTRTRGNATRTVKDLKLRDDRHLKGEAPAPAPKPSTTTTKPEPYLPMTLTDCLITG